MRLSTATGFLVLLALLAPGVVPLALAHGGDDHEHEPPGGGFSVPRPREGVMPGQKSYLSTYDRAWLYGASTVTLVGDQHIRMMHGDGEWLVWVDTVQNDVYAYNLAAGDGFYVTKDSSLQLYPRVDGNVVVWEDRRNGPADVFAYFLDTGESRRVSTHGTPSTNAQSPDVSYPWVVFEDDREGEWDVYAHDLETGAEMRVSALGQRDQQAVIVGSVVVWRTYRFNVWDLQWFDLSTGESGLATSDRAMELPPVRSEDKIYFLKEAQKGWALHSFDPETRVTRDLGEPMSTTAPPTVSGDTLVFTSFDGPRASFAALNLSSGWATRVSSYVPVMDMPVLLGRVLYAPVYNASGAALLAFTINPFALLKPPRLDVETPSDGTVLRGPTRVRGTLTYEAGWGDPDAFVFSLDGRNVTSITPGPRWSFQIDPARLAPGVYNLTIELDWKDAPPVVQTMTVVVPRAVSGLDLEREGRAFHFARVYGLYYVWIKSNPAILALALLVVGACALAIVRWRLRTRVVRRSVVEYVRQGDD